MTTTKETTETVEDEKKENPSTVKIGEEELTVEELSKKFSDLQAFKMHADRLLKHSGELDEKWEESTRFVLAAAGHSDGEINEYIEYNREVAAQQDDPSDTTGTQEDTAPSTPKAESQDEKETQPKEDKVNKREAELEAQLKEIRAEMEGLKKSQSSQRTEDLGRQLTTAAEKVLDSDPNVSVLLKASKDLNPDGHEEFRKILLGEVKDGILERVDSRSQTGANFRPAWFEEESGKAAESVSAKYRSAIGDPDKLRRAPETDVGENEFRAPEKVEDPTFDPKKDDAASVVSKARTFTEQALLKAAAETDAGGETKA